jgi:hypothetical protein
VAADGGLSGGEVRAFAVAFPDAVPARQVLVAADPPVSRHPAWGASDAEGWQVGELSDLHLRQPWGTTAKQADRLGPREDLEGHRFRQTSPGRVAGGDQHLPAVSGRP